MGCSLVKRGLACQQYCTDKAINRFAAHQQLSFWSWSYYSLCIQFFGKFQDKQAIVADIEVLLHIHLHLESHWAMPWWSDGKPTVYYFLGTDDTNWTELESFTVSLIPWWEALLNASSTNSLGNICNGFHPDLGHSVPHSLHRWAGAGLFGSGHWLSFLFHRAGKAAPHTPCDKRCFCASLSTAKWHRSAACCQCRPGLPEQPPGAKRPAASQPDTGRRRVRALRRIGNSVSQPCFCSAQMKTTSFTSSVLWLSRL